MGKGGLKKEFSEILHRVVASQTLPPDVMEQLGESVHSHKHVHINTLIYMYLYTSLIMASSLDCTQSLQIVVGFWQGIFGEIMTHSLSLGRFKAYYSRSMLLFQAPGCGKTLIACQIRKMLNTQEPQIFTGREILNKFMSESEANIRNLFNI